MRKRRGKGVWLDDWMDGVLTGLESLKGAGRGAVLVYSV